MRDGHPAWCSPRCEATLGRYHSGEPTVIPAQRPGETARLAVRVWGDGDGDPLVELTVGDHDDGHRCRADLAIRQVRALGVALGRVLDDLEDKPQPSHDGWPITGRHPR